MHENDFGRLKSKGKRRIIYKGVSNVQFFHSHLRMKRCTMNYFCKLHNKCFCFKFAHEFSPLIDLVYMHNRATGIVLTIERFE